MNKFEKKYGIKEDEKRKPYHRSRICFVLPKQALCCRSEFAIFKSCLVEKEGWMSPDNDDL